MSSPDGGGSFNFFGVPLSFGGGGDTDLNRRQRARFEAAGGNVIGHSEGRPRGNPAYEWQGERISKREAKQLLRAIDRGWVPGQPSPVDNFPGPAPSPSPSWSPWWAAAGAIAFPTKRERKRRTRAKKRAKVRSDLDRVMREAQKRAGEWAKKHPKVGGILTKYGGRWGRAARGGAWVLGPTVAWDLGQWAGGKIYESYSNWRYGPSAPRSTTSRPSKPRSIARKLVIRKGRITVPDYQRVPIPRGPATFPAPRNVAVKKPSVMRSFPALPGEKNLKKVQLGPKPAIKRSPARTTAPRPSSSSPAKPKYRLPDWLKPVIGGAILGLQSRSRPSTRLNISPGAPQPWQPPDTQGLTYLQAHPLSLASPAAAKCRCPKPKKRKPGKKACRNPVVRRSRRTSGGKRFSIITRELKCPA